MVVQKSKTRRVKTKRKVSSTSDIRLNKALKERDQLKNQLKKLAANLAKVKKEAVKKLASAKKAAAKKVAEVKKDLKKKAAKKTGGRKTVKRRVKKVKKEAV
jgi:F0F1-type ATP synthase membrane subunit b/b'